MYLNATFPLTESDLATIETMSVHNRIKVKANLDKGRSGDKLYLFESDGESQVTTAIIYTLNNETIVII